MKRRVVITGVGCVTPLGTDVETTWNNVVNGKNGITKFEEMEQYGLSVKVVGKIRDWNGERWIEKKELRRMDRTVQFAIGAASMALEDSGLKITDENSEEIGVLIGSGIGGMETFHDTMETVIAKGYNRVSPFFVPMLIGDMASGQVSIQLGAKGINSCTVTACASGANAIGDSFRAIERGDALAMITGGTEAALIPLSVAGFAAARAVTLSDDPETACRPFDSKRNGFVMGEGSGVVILEELEHALARGAHIYAEIVGYGATSDAHHITAPPEGGEGAQRAMKAALKDASLEPSDVRYINAHGTSTPMNDRSETQAIKAVFGEHAQNVLVSSTKSMIGHLFGAAGAVEAIFTVLAIKHNVAPPTIHFESADEDMDLDYVPNVARKADISVALSNNFGFGGHNACLAFKKYE
ncbi:MAG: beta-ketoacyl-ACP synthase II [Bacilli bacterium]